MKKLLTSINNLLAELSGWLISAIMIFLTIDFISRGISRPVQGVSEMAVFAMIATIYLGLAHCEEVNGHVRVEMVLNAMTPKLRAVVDLLVYLIALFCISVVLIAVWDNALSAYLEREAVVGPTPLLTYPVKFIMVIGLLFYLIQILINFIDKIRNLRENLKNE